MSLPLLESTARFVFHASWQAGVLAILIFFVCRVSSRLPAAVRCWLWLIVLIRFLVPTVPQSPASLFNIAKTSMNRATTAAEVSRPRQTAKEATTIEPVGALLPARDSAVVAEPSWANRAASIAVVVWLLGFLIVCSRSVLSMFGLWRLLSRCRPATDEKPLALLNACRVEAGIRRGVSLLVTDFNVAPALAGMVSPRIVVSQRTLESLGRDELRWLFRHELAHVRRWDLLIQRLWELTCAVHWFNPLAWWGASRARLAAELACDESLLRRTAPAEHITYGQALLNVADSLTIARPVPGAVGLLVREPGLTGRIRAIAAYRRRSRLWTISGSVLLIALALAGLTDAVENRGNAQQSASPAMSKASPSPSFATPESNLKVRIKIDPKQLATTKGKIRILVLERDGRPVDGAEVFANVVHPGDGRWLITNRTYFTDAAGMAVVELPPKVGITKIWASKKGTPGYPDLFACWFPGVESDASVIPEDFMFQPPLTAIGGVVNGEDGTPLRGVTIDVRLRLEVGVELGGQPGQRPVFDSDSYWTSSVPRPSDAITNSKGRWVMENVPLGAEVVLKLSCPGYVSEEIWSGVLRASPRSENQTPAPQPVGQMNAPLVLSRKERNGMQALHHQTASFVMRRVK